MELTTFEQLTQELTDYGCFHSQQHSAFTYAAACVSQRTPEKMKLMMAASELVLFASQLRKPIQLADNTIVPVNMFSFTLAGSGTSKDSSINQIRSAIKPAYSRIEELRLLEARKQSEYKSLVEDGNTSNWRSYYIAPNAIFVGVGTVEGQQDTWASLQNSSYGAGYVQESELGTSLRNNKNISENLEALAKIYDLGNLPPKVIKNKAEQVPAIEGLPVSANMFGTDQDILYNPIVKAIFTSEFIGKFGRRSVVYYNNETMPLPDYGPDKAVRNAAKRKILEDATNARNAISEAFLGIVEYTTNEPLTISAEAEDIYFTYQDYNEYKSRSIPHTHPITAIQVLHNHWKAQKIAGALAIIEQSTTIEPDHMMYAIRFVEHFVPSMYAFETELDKQSYELFADYIKQQVSDTDPKSYMSIHHLRKMGYIKSANSKVQIQELITNASSYDEDGIYASCDNGICYEKIVKTPVSGVSVIAVNSKLVRTESKDNGHTKKLQTLKGNLASSAKQGFEYSEIKFSNLPKMLKGDYAYAPFEFKDGIRGEDNIIGGCKWIALDVDNGKVTAEEMHVLLHYCNHHIALTSNSEDDFKYRILLEFDQFVDLDRHVWKHFVTSIAEDMFIKLDNLPRSQILFSYEAETIYSTTDQSPIETREHILIAMSNAETAPSKELTPAQSKALLADSMETFDYAYNLPMNKPGVKTLIAVAFQANELGASKDEIRAILADINDFWSDPLSPDRMNNQVYTVLSRF